MLEPRRALTVFRRLVEAWRIDEAQAWQMLAGSPQARSSLTADHARKVSYLADIDAGMNEIGGPSTGAWLVAVNPTPLLGGLSPLAYLTRQGLPGYVALLNQVECWRQL